MKVEFEIGRMRPPSEARSLPVRVTRNCPWNRCKFCRAYRGQRFALRPLVEIERDILAVKRILDRLHDRDALPDAVEGDGGQSSPAEREVANWRRGGAGSAFLQDANTLIIPTDDLCQVIRFLKATLPSITRVTTYSRSKTALKRSAEELARLREAGLSRVHIGLESGCDALLAFMDKGATAAEHIRGGRNVVAAGISLSEYVILGLGGARMWRQHAAETARVLNEIGPEFIRLRTLTLTPDMSLYQDMASGNFVRMTDEQVIEEEKLLISSLSCRATLVSDHATNLLPEIEGRLPDDKELMLAAIDRFQSLSPVERAIFRVGRRLSIYHKLDDLSNPGQSEAVERTMARLGQDGRRGLDESVIYRLMEGFVTWQPWKAGPAS